MNKMSVTGVLRSGKGRQFHATELPLIRKMVREIMGKKITYSQAMQRYNVTKYQVEKWLFYMRNEITAKQSEGFDEQLKQQIIKKILAKEASFEEVATNHKISISTIKSWIRRKPKLKNYAIEQVAKTSEEKHKVAQQVLLGCIGPVRAARINKVSRKLIHRWVREYGIFNLDGSINHQILKSMSSDQKEKELLAQIELLKKQLEQEKLKALGLETLIEVAEEKFGIKIKKKPGEKQ